MLVYGWFQSLYLVRMSGSRDSSVKVHDFAAGDIGVGYSVCQRRMYLVR
ncbi:hypothetical protein DSUL_100130 [Desulfovibrionales bacterium]